MKILHWSEYEFACTSVWVYPGENAKAFVFLLHSSFVNSVLVSGYFWHNISDRKPNPNGYKQKKKFIGSFSTNFKGSTGFRYGLLEPNLVKIQFFFLFCLTLITVLALFFATVLANDNNCSNFELSGSGSVEESIARTLKISVEFLLYHICSDWVTCSSWPNTLAQGMLPSKLGWRN